MGSEKGSSRREESGLQVEIPVLPVGTPARSAEPLRIRCKSDGVVVLHLRCQAGGCTSLSAAGEEGTTLFSRRLECRQHGGKEEKTMGKSERIDSADLLYQCTTTNGALAYSSSGDKCLDLFFIAGAMRYHDMERINMKFTEAYRENPELAMKLLFYIRDIRGGLGERDIFRRLIRTVAKKWPESALKNVRWIVEYGRWDDLLCLFGTRAEKEAVRVIQEQLKADMDALERRNHGDSEAHISLCAKWMPSSNASSARTRGNAKVLMRLLKLDEKQYRAILVPLRAAISLTEHYVTRRQFDRIQYDHVPSQALLRYDSLFTQFDHERYEDFMRGVRGGYRQMNTATMTPDQIVRRVGCFGFELGGNYNDCSGGRGHCWGNWAQGPKGQITQLMPARSYQWGKFIPVNAVRRPNFGGMRWLRPYRGDVTRQSRRWKAYYYNLRRWNECMPMRRVKFIGFYNPKNPEAWRHPFSPYDPGFVPVYLTYDCYAVYRLGSRFAGPRHVFRQPQGRDSYRLHHADEFWKSLPGSVGMENAISVIDTSASMMAYGAHTLADALGLFYAEHARGAFHNKFITFSEKPRMMRLRGDQLWQKLLNIHNASWGGTTNLEAVYRMLLRMAVRAKAGQDEMPSAVVIYSDMEFNRSVTNPYSNLYEECREEFENAGYEMPAVVFHNVNSLQMQTPVLSDATGAALSSGRTTHHMKHRYTGSTTPILHMMEVLMSERYAPIHA